MTTPSPTPATTFPADLVLIGASTITSFIPLTTRYTSISDCSSQIYRQLNGNLLAFDPFYKASISPNAPACLPPEVTPWWSQTARTGTGSAHRDIVTALGGRDFVCPGVYSPAATGLVDGGVTLVFCCPTSYTFLRQITQQGGGNGAFPSQCVSSLSSGQILAYDYITNVGDTWSRTTGTVDATAVNAIHVNGYRIPKSVVGEFTPSGSGSDGGTLTTSAPTGTGSGGVSNGNGNNVGNSAGGGMSTGAKAGIGIGVALGVVAFMALVGWLVRKKRKQRLIRVPNSDADGRDVHELGGAERVEIDGREGVGGGEMGRKKLPEGGGRSGSLYEMA